LFFLAISGSAIAGYIAPTDLEISGYVFLDTNKNATTGSYGNGVKDPGEWGINDIWIRLLSSTGQVVGQTVTKTDGSYSFGNLSPGTYSLVAYTPPTYTSTDGQFNGQALHNVPGGSYLSPTGAPYATGTGTGQVNPNWYGTLSYSSTYAYAEIGTINLPDPTYFGLPGLNGSNPTYAAASFNFGEYKAGGIPSSDLANPYRAITVPSYALPAWPAVGAASPVAATAADVFTTTLGPNAWAGNPNQFGSLVTLPMGNGNSTQVAAAQTASGASTTNFVGTTATIVAGSGSSTTASWRTRTASERVGAAQNPTLFPQGGALVSDVLNLGNITGAHVLEMTYDNTLVGNEAADQAEGFIHVDELIGATGSQSWVNAGVAASGGGKVANWVDPSTGNGDWNSFWAAYGTSETLSQLVGSWGVDTTDHEAWVVLPDGGAGVYAVVPEPGTFAMLGAAAMAGLGVVMVRRRPAVA
jgi:hypothetical protein